MGEKVVKKKGERDVRRKIRKGEKNFRKKG